MQERDFLHVEDVARAFVAALSSNLTGPFNIGSGHAVTVRYLIETLSRLFRRPDLVRFGARPRAANDPSSLYADTSAIREALGFTPTYTLESGLRDTAEWWQARG
jgi:nucleoside-diphosphate-sugar epimerase